jgi:predicted hydrocarbon binding protein
MPFHVDRFSLSFKEVVGEDPSSVLGVKLSEYKLMKTATRKASFIKTLMDKLLTKKSKRIAKKVMLECGYLMRDGVSRCINEHKIKSTKKSFAKSKNLKDFIERFNKHNAGKLAFEGHSIKATYSRCYCGAGWYKRLFEEVLDSPVRVKVLQSIANGADRCVMEISGVKS